MSPEELKNNLQKIADWVIITEVFSNITEFDKSVFNTEIKEKLLKKVEKYFPLNNKECF